MIIDLISIIIINNCPTVNSQHCVGETKGDEEKPHRGSFFMIDKTTESGITAIAESKQSLLSEVRALLCFCASVVEWTPDHCQDSRVTRHLPQKTHLFRLHLDPYSKFFSFLLYWQWYVCVFVCRCQLYCPIRTVWGQSVPSRHAVCFHWGHQRDLCMPVSIRETWRMCRFVSIRQK